MARSLKAVLVALAVLAALGAVYYLAMTAGLQVQVT